MFQYPYSDYPFVEQRLSFHLPKYFINNHLSIRTPNLGVVPFALTSSQQRMLDAFCVNPYNIINGSRQSGTSTVIAAYILWCSIFRPNFRTVIGSPSRNQSGALMDIIKLMIQCLPEFFIPNIQTYNKFDIDFENGSRICVNSAGPDFVRGYSSSLIVLENFAFIKPSIQEKLYIHSTISSKRLIINSTPNGADNFYAELWRQAWSEDNKLNPITVNWKDVPNRDVGFKEQTISHIGEASWLQEFDNQFIEPMKFITD